MPPRSHRRVPASLTAEAAVRRFEFLVRATRVLTGSLEYETTLAQVAQLMVPELADWCVVDLLQDGAIRRLAVAHADPDKVGLVWRLAEHYAPRLDEPEGVAKVLRTGAPALYREVSDELLRQGAHDAEHLRILRELGLRSAMIVPLCGREAVLGAISFVAADDGRQYSESDLHFAEEMARSAALAIENARLFSAAQHELAERRRAEDELRASRERLRQALEAADVWSWEIDLLKARVTRSRDISLLYALPPGSMCDGVEDLFLFIHPDDQARARHVFRQALRDQREHDLEYRIIRPDGSVRWIALRGRVVPDEAGRPVRMAGIAMDTTARREAELQLAAIVESSEDAIVGKDLNGIITSWNAAAERLYGYTAAEVIGKPIEMLASPERPDEIPHIMARLREGERVDHYETERMAKDGTRLQISLTVSPIRTSDGRVVGASSIARDISERRRTEDALRQSEKMAAAGRLAAIIAHEINNPLEAVTNLLYLLRNLPGIPPQGREFVTLAQQELGRVVHITKQTLGFYRDPLVPSEVSLEQLFDEVMGLFSRRVTNRSIEVQRRLEFTGTVHALPGELRQVLSNLVVNALEAAPIGGRIIFHVYPARDWATARTGVRIVLADNGPGMPPDVRRRIFEPFFTTKGDKGTGLGLWVSQGIMEKHGGRIRARSSTRAGRSGTVFSVFLPADVKLPSRRRAPPPAWPKTA